MRNFLFKKWRSLENKKSILRLYGDNANVMLRALKPREVADHPASDHSFPEAFGRIIKVPHYDLPPFFDLRRQYRTFHISEEEMARARGNSRTSRYSGTRSHEPVGSS